jgi:hypothetical protein
MITALLFWAGLGAAIAVIAAVGATVAMSGLHEAMSRPCPHGHRLGDDCPECRGMT